MLCCSSDGGASAFGGWEAGRNSRIAVRFMTARRLEALAAAMSILQQPQLARLARHSPLPNGMTFLLEAAVGDAAATADAAAATGRSEVTVRNAAGFFIEQVLLSPLADSYRILGAHSTSPEAELRRHMTLLMRWLHPDLVPHTAEGQRFDRSAYAARVTKAWDCLRRRSGGLPMMPR